MGAKRLATWFNTLILYTPMLQVRIHFERLSRRIPWGVFTRIPGSSCATNYRTGRGSSRWSGQGKDQARSRNPRVFGSAHPGMVGVRAWLWSFDVVCRVSGIIHVSEV